MREPIKRYDYYDDFGIAYMEEGNSCDAEEVRKLEADYAELEKQRDELYSTLDAVWVFIPHVAVKNHITKLLTRIKDRKSPLWEGVEDTREK